MRSDPIYLTTFTGRPPDEPSVLGEALNEVFIPLLRQQFPRSSTSGCRRGLQLPDRRGVDEEGLRRPRQAGDDGRLELPSQFMYTKWVIVVDDDIDARDWKDVMWAISTRMDPARDITVVENTPIDYLDFASPESGLGSKIGLDATNKWPPETRREWGELLAWTGRPSTPITEKWASLGLPGEGKPVD
jgi:4-hydroxy-3-polyprenylbenzoate decarboxylase